MKEAKLIFFHYFYTFPLSSSLTTGKLSSKYTQTAAVLIKSAVLTHLHHLLRHVAGPTIKLHSQREPPLLALANTLPCSLL